MRVQLLLDAADLLAQLNKTNAKLGETEKGLKNVAVKMGDVTDKGTRTVEVIKQQVDAYTLLTSTIVKYDGVQDSISQKVEKNHAAKQRDLEIDRQRAIATDKQAAIQRKINSLNASTINQIKNTGLTKIRVTKQVDAAQQKVTTTTKALNRAGQELVITQTKIAGKLVNVTKKTRDLAKAQQKQEATTKSLSFSLKGMAQLIATQLIRRAISALIAGIREGLAEAIELQKRIAEIQTIAQDNPLGADAFKAGVRNISDQYGFGILDSAEAAYQTLSNQVAKGAEVFEFQARAAEFARVTNSTLTDSVNLLSSAINSYGLSAGDADRTAAQMFKTIELGRVRASEVANTLGRVTVVSSQLGISLDEVNALLALTSNRGLKARQSLTQIRGTMNALLKPTEAMKDFFADLGVESGQAAIETFGLNGVLQRMQVYTKGNVVEIVKLVPRVRGLSATLSALANGGQDYADVLAKMTDAQNNYAKAVTLTADNAGVKLEKFGTVLKNVFVDDIGSELVQVFADTIGEVDEFKVKLLVALDIIATGAKAVGIALAVAFPPVLIAYPVLKALGYIIDGLASEELALLAVQKASAKATLAFEKDVNTRTDAVIKANQERLKADLQASAKIRSVNTEVYNAQIKELDKLKDAFGTVSGNIKKAIENNVNAIGSQIKSAENRIKKLATDTSSIIDSAQTRILEDRLDSQSPNKQVQTLVAEIKEKDRARREAAKAGNTSFATQMLKDELDLYTRLAKIDKERVERRKEIDEELIKLRKDTSKKLRDSDSFRDRKEINDQYKKDAKALQRERISLNDETTGKFIRNSKRAYTRIIEIAETQEKKLQVKEFKRIKELTAARKAAEVEVSIFKIKLQQIEKFDFAKAIEGKNADQVNAILERRKEDILSLQIATDKLAKGEARETSIILLADIAKQEALIARNRLKDIGIQKDKKQLKLIDDEKARRLKANAEIVKTVDKQKENVKLLAETAKLALENDEAIFNLENVGGSLVALEGYQKIINELAEKGTLGSTETELLAVLKLLDSPNFEKSGLLIEKGTKTALVALADGINAARAITAAAFNDDRSLSLAERQKQLNEDNLDFADKSIKATGKENVKLWTKVKILNTEKRIRASIYAAQNKQIEKVAKATRVAVTAAKAIAETKKPSGGYVILEDGQKVNFAKGGQAYGRDSVNARLTPGEFVINSASSRKFYSQLVGMNSSNNSLRSFNGGGAVSVGDVNVNMTSSGNESYDAQKIGKSLRREIRRGTLSL